MNEDRVLPVRVGWNRAHYFKDSCKKRNMAHKKSIGLPLATLLLFGCGAAGAQGPTSRLAGDWRSSGTVTIPQSKPPVAPAPATVLGAAPSGMRLERMILLLEPSAAQRQALLAELVSRQSTNSNTRWLTPSAFAAAYSNSPLDVAAVAEWLRSMGFQVAPLPAGLGWVEFSGTAGQAEQAFQTELKLVATAGGSRAVLASDVSVPAALRPVIHGLVSLDGVIAAPALTTPLPVTATAAQLAAEASLSRAEAATPKLMVQLLHLDALHASGSMGAGESIAIAGRSNVRGEDIAAFRSAFGLAVSALKVIPDGTDPGRTSDEAEAAISASWAGAAAPGAQIVLVPAATTAATDGLDLSLAAIVDQAMAHAVTVGYSACEPALSEAHQAFYAAIYRQAAAEGIAVIAAAGDSGPAACHAAGSDARVSSGYGVNALASTPWNTAVGVSAFGSEGAAGVAGLAAWSPVNAADPAYAGGGGASTLHAAPSWQTAQAKTSATAGLSEPASQTTLIQDLKSAGLRTGYRLVPDLALPAAQDSGTNRGLAFCLSGTAVSGGCNLVRAGGSSAAAAIFAGVAALVAEKYGAQGNMAPHLYAFGSASGVFDDVQQGSAQLACAAGSPGCGATERIGFTAGGGYDLATGLGSVNAQELVNKWPRPFSSGTLPVDFQISIDPANQNFYYNPSAKVTLSVNVFDPNGGGIPSGQVTFINATTGSALSGSTSATLDSSGNASVTVNLSTLFSVQGTYQVGVLYSGDSTYAGPVRSSEQQPITTQKSTMVVSLEPSTTSPMAGQVISVLVTVGVDPASVSPAGSLSPTGTVKLNLAGGPTALSYTAPVVTSAGVTTATFAAVTVPAVGQFTLQASYSGDTNYAGPVPSPSVSITVAQGSTTTSLGVTGTPALGMLNTVWTFTATITPSGSAPPVTGSVSFYDSGLLLGTSLVSNSSTGDAAVLSIGLANNISHNVTAIYAGDTNWTGSTSNVVPIAAVTLADFVVLTASNLPVDSLSGLPTASPGQAVILAATVTPAVIPPVTAAEQYPTGYVDFYLVKATGNTLLGRTLLVRSGLTDASIANFTTATLPGGTDTLVAIYEGDLYYSLGTSNLLTLGIQDFTITPDPSNPGTNVDIVQGSSGVATYDITGLGGFNGQIQVVCAVPSTDLPMTCTASPQQLVPNGTVTFVVQTFDTGSATASNRRPEQLWPRAAGGTTLALLGFFLLPMGRRARIFAGKGSRRFLVLLMLLIGLGGAGIGCNSVSLGGTSGAGGGTPLGVATLKITASEYVNNTVFSRSVYLTVNVLVKP